MAVNCSHVVTLEYQIPSWLPELMVRLRCLPGAAPRDPSQVQGEGSTSHRKAPVLQGKIVLQNAGAPPRHRMGALWGAFLQHTSAVILAPVMSHLTPLKNPSPCSVRARQGIRAEMLSSSLNDFFRVGGAGVGCSSSSVVNFSHYHTKEVGWEAPLAFNCSRQKGWVEAVSLAQSLAGFGGVRVAGRVFLSWGALAGPEHQGERFLCGRICPAPCFLSVKITAVVHPRQREVCQGAHI